MYSKPDVISQNIRKKKAIARKKFNLPSPGKVKPENKVEYYHQSDRLNEILMQIETCEELMTPLSENDVKNLCNMEIPQIRAYCKRVKFAS